MIRLASIIRSSAWLLLCAAFPLALSAQTQWDGQVVDAENGQPVPYVSIYLAPNRGAVANEEGRFRITFQEGDTARFSCIGYKKLTLGAAQRTREVRLEPLPTGLRQVTVMPVEAKDILKRLVRQLNNEANKFEKSRATYFFRNSLVQPEMSEMLEGFVIAHNAVNLHTFSLLAGRIYEVRPDTTDEKTLLDEGTNMHRLWEFAPCMKNAALWQLALKPLNTFEKLEKYYDYEEASSFLDEEGRRFYRIPLRYNHKRPKLHYYEEAVVQGTLYVESWSGRLVRFDGEVLNLFVRGNVPTTHQFHILYDHANGFTEVSSYFLHGQNELFRYDSHFFRVDKPLDGKERKIKEDLKSVIEGMDERPEMWSRYDVVRRTLLQEQLFGPVADDGD